MEAGTAFAGSCEPERDTLARGSEEENGPYAGPIRKGVVMILVRATWAYALWLAEREHMRSGKLQGVSSYGSGNVKVVFQTAYAPIGQ